MVLIGDVPFAVRVNGNYIECSVNGPNVFQNGACRPHRKGSSNARTG